ncbi:MAG: hypothetical protein QW231_05565, partial [Candidatus Bathyarchaeia archaeon]
YTIRLRDPITLLHRLGRWETGRERTEFSQKVSRDIKNELEAILHQSGFHLWTWEESRVFGEIFARLGDFLERFGLGVDPAVGARRFYPKNLYEIALRFGQAEQTIRYGIEGSQREALEALTGFSQEALREIATGPGEPSGEKLFRALIASPSAREKAVSWVKEPAATFIKELYTEDHPEQEIRLSEQVMLSAISNPMLTAGEWLRKEEETAHPTRFQRLQNRLESLAGETY